MKVVILIAGIGSRLGNPFPKCLTLLKHGHTILDHQLGNFALFVGNIFGVVGFKKDLVMEQHPELMFVYNPSYDQTNTAKSLLCALEHVVQEDVLWVNGDVVFDKRIIPELVACPKSSMAVIKTRVADEEIKFTVNERGLINAVSKQVSNGLGEAIGLNLVKAKDLALFKQTLRECTDQDYFEKGLEIAIGRGLELCPVDVGDYGGIEVDFPSDLEAAQRFLSRQSN